MTIDDIIALARDVERIHGTYGPPGNQAQQLGSAVLALLQVDQPCGWEESDIVNVRGQAIDIDAVHLTHPDEARWAAIQILRAAEKAEVNRG